ncbi:hypothetical protein PILCRDRAFT_538903 [Piloderma croceum F 1598]|uniref:Uncharacterized protein n=1 Tax=Piloderma croceum (strain F 1598) TaxID=765440 RepID=A0A0C3B1Y0_PILCF|nr:hypothetical protein PILCRDRAFT_538903 [Piloderma croceum F 1598]
MAFSWLRLDSQVTQVHIISQIASTEAANNARPNNTYYLLVTAGVIVHLTMPKAVQSAFPDSDSGKVLASSTSFILYVTAPNKLPLNCPTLTIDRLLLVISYQSSESKFTGPAQAGNNIKTPMATERVLLTRLGRYLCRINVRISRLERKFPFKY